MAIGPVVGQGPVWCVRVVDVVTEYWAFERASAGPSLESDHHDHRDHDRCRLNVTAKETMGHYHCFLHSLVVVVVVAPFRWFQYARPPPAPPLQYHLRRQYLRWKHHSLVVVVVVVVDNW